MSAMELAFFRAVAVGTAMFTVNGLTYSVREYAQDRIRQATGSLT